MYPCDYVTLRYVFMSYSISLIVEKTTKLFTSKSEGSDFEFLRDSRNPFLILCGHKWELYSIGAIRCNDRTVNKHDQLHIWPRVCLALPGQVPIRQCSWTLSSILMRIIEKRSVLIMKAESIKNWTAGQFPWKLRTDLCTMEITHQVLI